MRTLKLNYEDILSLATPVPYVSPNDYEQWTASAKEWGSYQEKNFRHNRVAVREIITDLEKDCQISGKDTSLPDSVHFYMVFSGSLAANYHSSQLFTELRARRHHHVYVPTTDYEWMISKKVHFFQIKIDREYFIGLLNDADPWLTILRDKVMRKETAYSGEGVAGPRMLQIIHEILHTRLAGSLKKIFIEAKVLEFIALQLDHSKEGRREIGFTVKKRDRDILASIHDYLAENFSEDHSLGRLARIYGLNEFTLKKGFKSLYGKTIFDYLFEIKMNHARRLLVDEGKLVREVSREVGYKNPHHFSTAFKKKFGLNPMLLRQ